jgi:TM2 domain-containing membrane protein YozV
MIQQDFPELAMLQDMTEQQRMLFLAQYHSVKKDVVAGVLLAVLLGHFGAHRFYMGEIGWGIVYLLFCWTGIPTILGVIEAFLMPNRVRAYNFAHASLIAAQIRATPSGLVPAGV